MMVSHDISGSGFHLGGQVKALDDGERPEAAKEVDVVVAEATL
jgi:hypothetical protein